MNDLLFFFHFTSSSVSCCDSETILWLFYVSKKYVIHLLILPNESFFSSFIIFVAFASQSLIAFIQLNMRFAACCWWTVITANLLFENSFVPSSSDGSQSTMRNKHRIAFISLQLFITIRWYVIRCSCICLDLYHKRDMQFIWNYKINGFLSTFIAIRLQINECKRCL